MDIVIAEIKIKKFMQIIKTYTKLLYIPKK